MGRCSAFNRLLPAMLLAGLPFFCHAQESPASAASTPSIVTASPQPPEAAAVSARHIRQLFADGKPEEALATANHYLEFNSQDGAMLFTKAQILQKLGRTDEAISVLEGLTERFPEMVAPYNNLAVLYASRNRLEDARKMLEMAVAIQPNFATAYENLADLYLAMARQAYAHALALEPNSKSLKAKAAKLN